MGTMDHARISTVAVDSGKLKFQLNGVPSRPANGRAGWRPRRPSCSPTLRELNALAVRSMPSYDGTAVGDGSAVTLRRRFVVFASSQSEPAPSEAPRPLRRRVAFPAEPGDTPFTPAEFEIPPGLERFPAPLPIGQGIPMDCVTLNNGVSMPILGFGVYQVPPVSIER